MKPGKSILLKFFTTCFGPAVAGLSLPSAHAASGTWSSTPTNGIWEATGIEANWLTGAATFPGDTSGTTTNTDVATFSGTSSITAIAINSTAGNSTPLNLGGITFTGPSKSAYTIGSTGGNALWLSSGGQIVISGAGSSVAGNTETVNAPIVLQPATSTTAGSYTFQNNSTLAGDVLVIGGSVSGGVTTQGITLNLIGASTLAANSVSGSISNGGAALGVSVVKDGVGAWTLSGANSYTGATTVQGGGTLHITGTNSGGGNYAVNTGTLNINSSGTVSASGLSYGAFGSNVNVNGGTLSLAGAATTSGSSAFRFLTLNAGGTLSAGSNLFTSTAMVRTQLNGGTLKSNNAAGITWFSTTNVGVNSDVEVLAGGGTLDTTVGNISVGTAAVSTTSGGLSGTLGGTLTIKGGNTLSAGINNTGLLQIQEGSTWNLNGVTSSVAGLSGNGFIVNSGAANGTLTTNFASTSGPHTYSGNIAPATTSRIALVKNGTGTQILTGANTYTGATTISGGTLQIGDGGTIGSLASGSAISIASGASLVFNRSNPVTQGADFSSTDISGAGSVIQNGTGTLTLNTVNSYSGGTTISSGAISATGSGALGSGTVTNSGRLLVSNNITLANGVNIAGQSATPVTASGRIENVSGNNAINGNIIFNNFGGSYAGITSTSGTLTLGGDLTAAVVTGSRIFSFAGSGNTTSNGNISDGSAVVGVQKDGSGTLTLAGSANTYTGATTVTAGKLVVNGNVTTSIVNVTTGAAIGGAGSIGGNLTVASGAFLEPGNSAGNLTLGNGLDLEGTYTWELAALSTANPGTDFDTVTVNAGSVDITGALLQLSLGAFAPGPDSFWQTDQTWAGIINNIGAGSLDGTFAGIDNTAWISFGSFSTTTTGNDVNLVWTAVPEPASGASLGLAGMLILFYRRRSAKTHTPADGRI